MNFVLTTAGRNLVSANPAQPIEVDLYRLGDSFNYIPSVTDTGLHGTTVAFGTPSKPFIISPNLVRYSIALDRSMPTTTFGEVGLYVNNVLFALASFTTPQIKNGPSGGKDGVFWSIDAYIPSSGTNYDAYAGVTNSTNVLNISSVSSVEQLPNAIGAYPNLYSMRSPDSNGDVIAFSNNARWQILGYDALVALNQLITSGTTVSCVGPGGPSPAYPGELVIQFLTGANAGICRVVTGYLSAGNQYQWTTPLTQPLMPNDTYQIHRRTIPRPQVAAIFSGLRTDLTAAHLNDLVNYPVNKMFLRDGSQPMIGDLDMAQRPIHNVPDPVLPQDAVNLRTLNTTLGTHSTAISQILNQVQQISNNYLRKDGVVGMTGNLNMAGQRINNLANPVVGTDAVPMSYVDQKIQQISGLVVSNHNALSNLQGGSGVDYYHVSAAAHGYIENLVANGLPVASQSVVGGLKLATTAEVSTGLEPTKAVTPETLRNALVANNGGVLTPLQAAVLTVVNSGANSIQFGAGAPTGTTLTSPPVYFDISASPYVQYVYNGGAWRDIGDKKQFNFGSGVPTSSTPSLPNLYIDISSSPYQLWCYINSIWTNLSPSAVQFGSGAPSAGTPKTPPMYIDNASDPGVMYLYTGTVWLRTGSAEYQFAVGSPTGTTPTSPPFYFDISDPLNYKMYFYRSSSWHPIANTGGSGGNAGSGGTNLGDVFTMLAGSMNVPTNGLDITGGSIGVGTDRTLGNNIGVWPFDKGITINNAAGTNLGLEFTRAGVVQGGILVDTTGKINFGSKNSSPVYLINNSVKRVGILNNAGVSISDSSAKEVLNLAEYGQGLHTFTGGTVSAALQVANGALVDVKKSNNFYIADNPLTPITFTLNVIDAKEGQPVSIRFEPTSAGLLGKVTVPASVTILGGGNAAGSSVAWLRLFYSTTLAGYYGVWQTSKTTTPGVGSWKMVNDLAVLSAGDMVMPNNTAAMSISLPPVAVCQDGDSLDIFEGTKPFSQFPVTIKGNGSNIMGSTNDILFNSDAQCYKFVFRSNNWRIYKIGVAGYNSSGTFQ